MPKPANERLTFEAPKPMAKSVRQIAENSCLSMADILRLLIRIGLEEYPKRYGHDPRQPLHPLKSHQAAQRCGRKVADAGGAISDLITMDVADLCSLALKELMPVSLSEAKPSECRFPIGGNPHNLLCCGEPSAHGKPYCDLHTCICYVAHRENNLRRNQKCYAPAEGSEAPVAGQAAPTAPELQATRQSDEEVSITTS